ncbi:MAG: 30S ribosomal protein S13 [Planctomycetota bacterium]|jgi:small subunit ribosomal protein S13
MPRIVGVDIPNDKSIWISLTYIFGIGKHTSSLILKEVGIDERTKASDLSEDDLSKITRVIDQKHIVSGELRRQISQHISRLGDIKCYRGVRHRRGLPLRGQHTRTNARTRKGPRKTVAGKRGGKEKR